MEPRPLHPSAGVGPLRKRGLGRRRKGKRGHHRGVRPQGREVVAKTRLQVERRTIKLLSTYRKTFLTIKLLLSFLRLHMRSEEWERLPDMEQGRATHGCSTTFYKAIKISLHSRNIV